MFDIIKPPQYYVVTYKEKKIIIIYTSLFQIGFNTNETFIKYLIDTAVVAFKQMFRFIFVTVVWNRKKWQAHH